MPFTEFCCRSGGSNLNAGTRTGNSTEPGTAADFTYASGNWVAATGVFTVSSGNPSTDGVAVGDYASVYADGSTVTGFVGRVTAIDTTTVTVSLTVKSGTVPTDGTGNRTLRIGGAWLGPNGSSGFPFTFVTNSLGGSLIPRVNFKNDATFTITSAITNASSASGVIHQGYATAYADFGRATIQGPASGASFVLLSGTGSNGQSFVDFIFDQNGSTGSAAAVICGYQNVIRCVATRSRGSGFVSSAQTIYIECEAYGNNLSNTAGKAGFENVVNDGSTYLRCISHDNTGSNSAGFKTTLGASLICCVADTNGGIGFDHTTQRHGFFLNCDAYNNGSDGLRLSGGSVYGSLIENCNFAKNNGWGINVAAQHPILIQNCAFGSGTQANASGAVSTANSVEETGTITYANNVTPWVDPANGDFRINLAAAKNAGRGAYTQTAASYSGTVGYPDIGAAQAQATGSGARQVNIRGGADQ